MHSYPGEEMIILYLVVFIVALILANILIAIVKPKRRRQLAFSGEPQETQAIEPQIITALQSIDEKHSLVQGTVSAVSQKISILNERVTNLENAVTGIIETRVDTQQKHEADGLDYEKLDFRVKVLEQKIDETGKPKEAQKQKTFFGKVDDEMEKEIRSLAFNTKKAQAQEITN